MESENGFITYEIYDDGSCYIHTLWVDENCRNNGEGYNLEQELIKKENPKVLFCDIDKKSNNWLLALVQICKKADYKILEEKESLVILYKELK